MARSRASQCQSRLAIWSFVVLTLILTTLLVTLVIASGDDSALFVVPVYVIVVIGAIILTYRPGNAIGWLMLTTGTSAVAVGTIDAYARFAATRDSWPFADWAALTANLLLWFPLLTYMVLLLLLFPTGSLLSRRWWVVVVLFALYVVINGVLTSVRPGVLEGYEQYPQLENPAGMELYTHIAELNSVIQLLITAVTALAAISAIIRFHRSRGVERQQMKWFAFVAASVLFFLVLLVAFIVLIPDTVGIIVMAATWFAVVLGIMIGLPVTIAIAILRFRLYDIDRIISRTLVYGSLTALLVLGFAGNVLLLQFVLSPLTSGNDLAVSGSTLLVFALFRPLRDRLQMFIDRRFYRQKYDAALTLKTFRELLRDEIDLDTLSSELQVTVSKTIQPVHIGIWLRPTQETRR